MTIKTNLEQEELIKRLEKITLPYEKINFTQFKSDFKYKGKIDESKFILEDINVGYKIPSNIIKGQIVITNTQKVNINIEIENPGEAMSIVLLYAMGYPFGMIVLLLLFIYNDDLSTNFTCLLGFVALMIFIKPKKTSEINMIILNKLKRDLDLIS